MKRKLPEIASLIAAITLFGGLGIAGISNAQNSVVKAKPAAQSGAVSQWRINTAQSYINWETKWTDKIVTGRFNSFDANIRFSPTNLAASNVVVNIPANGFNSASPEARSNLPLADWLNTRAFPTIRFESNSFAKTGADTYVANGFLTVKGVKYRLALPFRLQNTGANSVIMTSQITLDRINLKIGLDSDPSADWVARQVQININLNASK